MLSLLLRTLNNPLGRHYAMLSFYIHPLRRVVGHLCLYFLLLLLIFVCAYMWLVEKVWLIIIIFNLQMAEAFREEGNSAFHDRDYERALMKYLSGIECKWVWKDLICVTFMHENPRVTSDVCKCNVNSLETRVKSITYLFLFCASSLKSSREVIVNFWGYCKVTVKLAKLLWSLQGYCKVCCKVSQIHYLWCVLPNTLQFMGGPCINFPTENYHVCIHCMSDQDLTGLV